MRLFFRRLGLCALMMTPLAGQANIRIPRYEFTYTCEPGRFTLLRGSVRHYCWDKKHYVDANVPPEMREFFADRIAADERSSQNLKANAQWSRKRIAELRASGMSQFDATVQAHYERAAMNKSQPAPSAPAQPAYQARAVAPVATTPRPPEPPPLSLDQLKAIEPGTSPQDVLAKLGRPAGKVVGEGTESWTYRLERGLFGRVRFADGKVKTLVLPD